MHLLAHFHELSLHPKNTKELKGLILQLAVQGKLTAKWRAENPDVEPASVLLERIKAEKAKLVAEKKIRKEKVLPPIEEVPFEVPEGWEWEFLGNLAVKITDGTHHSPTNDSNGTYKYVSAKNIKNNGVQLSNITYVSEEAHEEIYSRCNPEFGDILYIKDGATTGICCINNLEEEFSMLSSVALIKNSREFVNEYLLGVFRSPYYYDLMRAGMSGVAITRVTLKKLKNSIVPLPPLAEQKAIVQVVDQLFQEVEQLEQLTEQRVQLKQDYVTSAMHQLASGDTAREWASVHPHFHTFFDEGPTIKKLRETILQLAVQGKLTAKWRQAHPDVEPASALLERIKAEKAQLIAEKKIRKEKALAPIGEVPYAVPEGWEWCRLKRVGLITGGGTPSKRNLKFWDGDIPWVSPKDMKTEFITKSQDNITIEGVNNSSAKLIPKGSILVVGRSGILKRKLPVAINNVECAVNQDMKVIIPYIIETNIFIQKALWGLENIILNRFVKYGMTVHSLKYADFELMPFPLPPLPEQQAIVAEVNRLMALCDALEAAAATREAQVEQLMQAVLREVFKGEKVQV